MPASQTSDPRRPLPTRPDRRASDEPTTGSTDADAVGAHPVAVLAIDDDSVFLAGIARLLRGADCIVSSFVDPEQALAHLLDHVPELVLVDLHMPRMSGLEFLQRASFALDATPRQLYLQTAAPPSPTDTAEATRFGATVLDKGVVLQRAWLNAAVHRCREPESPGGCATTDRQDRSRR